MESYSSKLKRAERSFEEEFPRVRESVLFQNVFSNHYQIFLYKEIEVTLKTIPSSKAYFEGENDLNNKRNKAQVKMHCLF